MKNILPKAFAQLSIKFSLLSVLIIFVCNAVTAQLATYPLRTGTGMPTAGTVLIAGTSPNVTANILIDGGSLLASSFNGSGYRVKTQVGGTGVTWPIAITNGFHFDIPISPNAGFDMHITGITGWDSVHSFANSATRLFMEPYYQADGGAWVRMNGASTVSISNTPSGGFNFGAINETFYSGHTYTVRFYVYGTAGTDKNDNFRLKYLVFNGSVSSPPASAPTVTTLSPTVTGLYSANTPGSYQSGSAFHTVYQSGVVWSTSVNPTYPSTSSTSNGSAGTINSAATGLNAGTLYHVRAYIITQFGTFYGGDSTFRTLPPTAPVVSTSTPVTNILSNKAIGGGVIVDSGGLYVIDKGLCWGTSPAPTTTVHPGGNSLSLGGGSQSFSDWMKQLAPGTTYYVRAYARNSIGITYGADVQFTTAAAAPVIVAIPGNIDFGENLFGATALTISYTLSGAFLTGGSGNITATAPAGFFISTSNGGPWNSTVATIPYTGTTLPATPIYVQMSTGTYGTPNGNIIHAGGGVIPANADTVKVGGTVVQSPDNVTNNGNDFWLGFGYQEKMSKDAGDADEAKMSVYVTTGPQAATVHVELPSVGYNKVFTIPGNSSYEFTNFPTGDASDAENPSDLPDARLFKTGVSNKAVHVYSDNGVPVGAFLHTYTNKNSAAGAMLFPTSTWNSSYTVQAFGGTSNNSNPNSFFFVIANEDNTVVTFTPTQPILDASSASLFSQNQTTAGNTAYAANGTYSVSLNRGQVFNAMGGFGSGSVGLDLSGSKVSTTCDKKIAVFGGNGRVLVNANVPNCTASQGSDHLIQQMFPNVAWGTRYLTAPTKTMEFNYFRIYVQDPATVVKINGTALPLASLFNNLYYPYSSALPLLIESDKPINVSQFITAGACANNNGAKGNGDPEMIILSPLQQAITSTTVYSAPFRGIGASPVSQPALANGTIGNCASFINVVIPTAGVASFRLDGVAVADTGSAAPAAVCSGNCTAFSASTVLLPMAQAFKPHPQDATYSMAKFWVTTAKPHTLSSDVAFNAIAYGVGNGESYGYNAGTSVKNLTSVKVAVNPNGTDTSTTSVRTCKDNLVTLQIALPHNASLVDSIVWGNATPDPRITTTSGLTLNTGAIVLGDAQVTGTIVVDGITFNVYTCPVKYSFNQLGTYVINVTAYGTFASDCPGKEQQKISVIVGRDNVNFTYSALCGDPNVQFTNNTIPMAGATITSLLWDFGDTQTSTSTTNPITHLYTPPPTLFTVKLSTTNSFGCNSSDSVLVDISGGIRPRFTIAPKDTICTGSTITFDPSASSVTGTTAGTPVKWTWNFGAGEGPDVVVNGATSPNQAHTYNTAGLQTVTLTLETSNGCKGVIKDTVIVEATPVAAIAANPTFVCLGDSAAYTDASTIAVGNISSWLWTFDNGSPLTSTLKNPKHLWTTSGPHTVTLTVKSAGGCSGGNTATHTINVNPLPTAGFKYGLDCTTRVLSVTDTSNANGGTVTGWNWDFGVTPAVTSTLQNPSYTCPAAGTYTVTLYVTTANGCKSATVSKTITIAASPVADFTLPGNTCLPNASPVFVNTTTISDGTIALVTYTWNFGDNTGDLNAPADIPTSPTHVFPASGTPAPPYTIKLTAISNNGCTNTVSKVYNSIYAAPVAVIAPQADVCASTAVNFSSASSTAVGSSVNGWTWNFNNEGSSSSQNPSFTFLTAGTKTVTLTITSAAGCTSAPDTILVTVNALPTANFSDTINCTTRSVGFTDGSVPNAGVINQWNWNFGTGEGTSTLQNPTHVFTTEGNHTVTLSVKTDKGCTSSVVATQVVYINARPVADFTLPGNVCLPTASATFTNTTTIGDLTLPQVVYSWTFGDGGTSAVKDPVHAYTAVGPHTVTLVATSNQGCVNSISKTYNKVFAQPVAIITAPAGVCIGNAASFSSASSSAAASTVTGWQWSFGDSPLPGSSTQQNPTYTYTSSGAKTISLTVTSAEGCSSTVTTQGINVNLSPVAAFTYSSIRCEDSAITFNDASVANAAGGITQWNWTFESPATVVQTTAGPITHTFGNAQTYPVSLSVKNANGCLSAVAFTTPVVINPNPVSKFKVSDICIPAGLASFTHQATISSGQITNWAWDFGVTPSATSTLQNPTYNYTTGGVYTASLKVTSDSSCTSFSTLQVSAFNSPTALYDVTNPTNLCSNLPVSIVNKSVVTGFGTVDKIEVFWDYANNPTVKSTINAPALNDAYTNQYPVFGNQPSKQYNVLIRAYSGSGCSTDYSTNIDVLAAPKAQFTQPAPVCQEIPSFSLAGGSDIFGLTGTGIYSGPGVISSPVFSPSSAGAGTKTIRFTYTTTNGCSDYAEQSIVVNPTPVINFGSTIINVLEGDVLQLSPKITNGATYVWSPATFLNNSHIANPFSTPTSDIIYKLEVTSDKGCIDDESVEVKVVRNYVVPNTFTPNGDGNHDTWDIENLAKYPDVRVRVFSRSGQLVFESYGYNTQWNGKYKGADLPFGTYYYVIETGGGRKPRTGYVVIIR